ncbi:hypothetical protein F5X97DRAFT_318989 [Nemania serpens]|nr:hypothetical protein F5X97DRAFT_318989 [Nemania serpens]
MSQSNWNGPQGIELPAFDFQIAPESGLFLTKRTRYRITIRHTNCAKYDGLEASSSTTQEDTSPPLPRQTDNRTTVVKIVTGSLADPDDPKAGRLIEVCPGGCNEKTKGENYDYDTGTNDDERSSEDIAAQLYDQIRTICNEAHTRGAEVLEVFDTRIIWNKTTPTPAYLSPSQMSIVEHSHEVTSGHLALIQARGNKDKIGLGFRTYDYCHIEPTTPDRPGQIFHSNC